MFDDLVVPGSPPPAPDPGPAGTDGGLITFAAVSARATAWAGWLERQGVGAGAVVTVELDEPAELLAAVLAIWSVGGRALPFYRGWWARERSGVLDLTTPDLRLRVGPPADLGPSEGPLSAGALVAPGAELWGATPGATGEPAIFRFDAEQLRCGWLAPLPGLAPATVHVTIDPAHPPTLRFVLGALFGGCAVHVVGPNPGPAPLERALRSRPGVLWCTPPILRRLVHRLPRRSAGDHQPLPAAAVVVGSPLRRRDVHDADTALAGPVRSLLTTSEAGGWAHDLVVVGPDGVLPCPPGAAGRLAVGGPHAARSRVGGLQPGAAGWPTGDLAEPTMGAPGAKVVGRAHDAWWNGGRLVHPHRAEEAIAEHPGVADVAVVERHGRAGVTAVAVVVPTDDRRPPFLADLADHLAALHPAERPTAQWIVERLPLNAAGVVDRRRLRYEESSR